MLDIENLSVGFVTDGGIVPAVKGLNLSLTPGCTMGLVGESGSGKSVTALAVMGLLDKRAGRITTGNIWFKHPVTGNREDLLQLPGERMQAIRGNHISMVFQEPMSSLNPVQRCGQQVMEVLLQHKKAGIRDARTRVLTLFDEVKLPDPERAFRAWPHELSGGQRQRVMIAMAMACHPALMIADEPTTALDVTVQRGIIDLMKQLQRDHGMAILFISHDLGVVSEIASHASVMLNGEVVETGEVDNILRNPVQAYTKALVACRPPIQFRPERLLVVDDFIVKAPGAGPHPQQVHLKPESVHERNHRHLSLYAAPPVLEVKDLTTSFVTSRNVFGRPLAFHQAVDKISFDVYQGETLGLVGESGCGKTTLGRSLMRLVEPAGGQVIYKGRNLASLSSSEMKKLRPKFQIIFQDPYASLTPGMMVGPAIMEPMRVHGILKSEHQRKARVMELLERVNLAGPHFYRYPHEFSGGQRQRICIARALALNPEFIICDEAVSALDVSVQAQVLNLLNEMKKEFGLTFIFISHDLSVVKYMSDRVVVMKGGKMIEMNEADRLYENPADPYTKSLIEAIPGLTFLPSSLQ